MGHLQGAKNNLIPLIDRLNQEPIGLADNEKLRKILAIIYTETEAFVASRFPLKETTLEELITATGMKESELLPVLDSMADKGLVMDIPFKGVNYYLLIMGMFGFLEMLFMRNRTDLPMDELSRLLDDYLDDYSAEGMGLEVFGNKTPWSRTLVYEDKIPVSTSVTAYEDARRIIESAKYKAITMCFCRHKKEHLGLSCKRGVDSGEICIVFGEGAKFMVRRGLAEEKSTEELLKVLEYARSKNLTHMTDNIREKPSFLCNCCQCCCEIMSSVQHGLKKSVGKTGYLATIDSENCNACGRCEKVCNVLAIGQSDEIGRTTKKGVVHRKRIVNEDTCLGCAACVSLCKHEAISMVERPVKPEIPMTRKERHVQVLKEKGRL